MSNKSVSFTQQIEDSLNLLSQFSQGHRKGATAKELMEKLAFMVEKGLNLKYEIIYDTCAICTKQLQEPKKVLVCGHQVHSHCLVIDDYTKGKNPLDRKCSICKKDVQAQGRPESAKCCICEQNIPEDMLVILQCGEDQPKAMHFYCKRDFEGMVDAAIQVKAANVGQILCQANDCECAISEQELLHNISIDLSNALKDYRKSSKVSRTN